MSRDDKLLFGEKVVDNCKTGRKPWKVLIANDEEGVHAVTRMVLDGFTFEGRGLVLLSAYSGAETKTLLREHPDIAVLLQV